MHPVCIYIYIPLGTMHPVYKTVETLLTYIYIYLQAPCTLYIYIYIPLGTMLPVYRVSQEECARLREGVPYVKVYRYNPKHLCLKLNGYGDNGRRKVGASCGSKYCNLHS